MSTGRAAARYNELSPDREPFLYRANICAKLTVPSLFQYPRPSKSKTMTAAYQSLGAQGVNNLASKLQLSLLPPNTPCFRYMIDELVLEKEQPDPEFQSKLEEALSKFERAVMKEIEGSGDRVAVSSAMRHLIVVGNVLLYDGPKGMKLYPLDKYVVSRDPSGNPLEIIAREEVALAALPKDFLASIQVKVKDGQPRSKSHTTVTIYTHLEREDDTWSVYQECEGERVPGTSGTYPVDACPWMALRFTRDDSEDYGRSYIEDVLGDLNYTDGVQQALMEGSLAMAKMLVLVNPNGATSLKSVAKAKNCDVISGKADDVTAFQANKFSDFRSAKETMDTVAERLSYAFLLHTTVQRQAERVTAEEIRYVAAELETALGGIYSIMTTEFLLPYIQQKIAKMNKAGKLPTLPKDVVRPVIVVGVEALGRGTDRTKLLSFLKAAAETLTPQVAVQFVNAGEVLKRLATADGIDTKNLIKTPEQQQQEAQQAQQQAMIGQLGPHAMKLAGDAMKAGMVPAGEAAQAK